MNTTINPSAAVSARPALLEKRVVLSGVGRGEWRGTFGEFVELNAGKLTLAQIEQAGEAVLFCDTWSFGGCDGTALNLRAEVSS